MKNAMTDEQTLEWLQSKWEQGAYCENDSCVWINSNQCYTFGDFNGHTPEARRQAARKFTEERLEAIAEVEEEIAEYFEGAGASKNVLWDMDVVGRTIGRLKTALAELRRGMKEQA